MSIRSTITAGILATTTAAAIGTSLATGASAAPAPAPVSGPMCTGSLASLCPAPAEATITAVVQNNTDATMYYRPADSWTDGHFTDAPTTTIAPHTSETISVSGHGSDAGVSMHFDLYAPWGYVGDTTLVVNNHQSQTNTDGTAASIGVRVATNFVHAAPNARYNFIIS